MVGEKLAIVSDKPQTTRTRIIGVKNYPDGQVVFVDTPGIHRPLHRMNVRMVDAATDTLKEVDVVGVVVDVSEKPGHGLRFLFDLVKGLDAKTVLILNKVDLVKKHKLLPLLEQLSKEQDWHAMVPVSALTGDEMVREQVLRLTHDELPFSTAVMLDRWEEEEGQLLRLYMTILVERDSQKPIVIGRGGEMIKEIGTAARQEIQQFLDRKVFLDLRVAVRELWRENDRLLDELGVRPPEK
jgi:GTP-binding protein Era